MKRRNFIFDIFSIGLLSSITSRLKANNLNIYPMVRSISTWKTTEANLMAGSLLEKGVDALSAAVSGVAIEEENPKNTTVGYGGAPDRSGIVTLDACVMNHIGDCGSVIAVENIVNVARLAKDVMEKTPHVMLAGKGAQEFAISEGYKKEDLLTQKSKEDWKKWLESEDYKPIINIENHDTIGMLCLDKNNNISGACSTSGLAYKMKGRVGDSPIIGSGTWAQNGVCGVSTTGHGEFFIKYQVAREVCVRMEYINKSISDSSKEILMELKQINAYGGLIAIDSEANISMPFNTHGMIRGSVSNKTNINVAIY